MLARRSSDAGGLTAGSQCVYTAASHADWSARYYAGLSVTGVDLKCNVRE